MRTLIHFLTLLVILPLIASPAMAETTVSVMSFNIRYGTAKDGDNAWPNRRDLVAETIQRRDPDLLGLQEALPFQVEFLAEALPQYEVYAVPRVEGAGGETCAIFYRRSSFARTDAGTFWLSETPEKTGSVSWDSSLPRIVSWLLLKPSKSDQPILFANTHFDHKGAVARAESARLLRQKLPRIAEGAPIIVTGDFNCGEGSEPWLTLTGGEDGFLDTYRQHVSVSAPEQEVTFTGFGLNPGSARIDWILCSKQWRTKEAGIDRHRRNGRYPSDHEPVFAILSLDDEQ